MKSLLITIEGLDGSGKSTLAKELPTALRSTHFTKWIYQTREPGRDVRMNNITFNRPGVDVRSIVLNETMTPLERELLFYVDAAQHCRFIENQNDAVIVSDRGKWSHLAYLRGYLKTNQMNWDDYRLCKKIIDRVCAEPDVVIYLRADLSLMKNRLFNKPKDAIERNGDDFYSAVLETYTDLAKGAKNALILDAYDNLDKNIMKVIDYLKGAYHVEHKQGG